MKKYIISGLIILNSILTHFCFAQFNDKPIRLSPEIGDTLDLSERNYYNLFPEIRNFQYAVYYINSDSTSSISIVTYINGSGMPTDTLINYSRNYIGNLKASIRQTNAERLENYKSDVILKLTKLNGKEHSGKVLSVQDSCLIIVPYLESEVGTQTFLKSYAEINLQEIQSVLLEFGYPSDIGIATLTGFLIGLPFGLMIGVSTAGSDWDDKFSNGSAGMLIGMLAGATAGFIVGLTSGTSSQTIEINSASDLERLKEYVVQ